MTETTETTARRRIIAGVDSSKHAARAAMWAAQQAAALGVPLHLVHATDIPSGSADGAHIGYAQARREAAEKLLSSMCGDLRAECPDVNITTEVSDFGAPETLVALSRSAQFVVTGTRGHGGFAGLLLGSVSLKVAAHAHCPAVVVRGEQLTDCLNEIVLGVQADESAAPIEFAIATAAKFGASVRAVRAWQPFPASGSYYVSDFDVTGREATSDVAALLKEPRGRYPDVPVIVDVVRGNAVPILLEASRGSRLLVVGAHRRRAPLSVGAGYVVQGLLSHAAAPVAVVPIV